MRRCYRGRTALRVSRAFDPVARKGQEPSDDPSVLDGERLSSQRLSWASRRRTTRRNRDGGHYDSMRSGLATDRGGEPYRKGQPVFEQMKFNRGLDRFRRRVRGAGPHGMAARNPDPTASASATDMRSWPADDGPAGPQTSPDGISAVACGLDAAADLRDSHMRNVARAARRSRRTTRHRPLTRTVSEARHDQRVQRRAPARVRLSPAHAPARRAAPLPRYPRRSPRLPSRSEPPTRPLPPRERRRSVQATQVPVGRLSSADGGA